MSDYITMTLYDMFKVLSLITNVQHIVCAKLRVWFTNVAFLLILTYALGVRYSSDLCL